jgi:hypothetical protein
VSCRFDGRTLRKGSPRLVTISQQPAGPLRLAFTNYRMCAKHAIRRAQLTGTDLEGRCIWVLPSSASETSRQPNGRTELGDRRARVKGSEKPPVSAESAGLEHFLDVLLLACCRLLARWFWVGWCWPDFPAVPSTLADLGARMAGLDGQAYDTNRRSRANPDVLFVELDPLARRLVDTDSAWPHGEACFPVALCVRTGGRYRGTVAAVGCCPGGHGT